MNRYTLAFAGRQEKKGRGTKKFLENWKRRGLDQPRIWVDFERDVVIALRYLGQFGGSSVINRAIELMPHDFAKIQRFGIRQDLQSESMFKQFGDVERFVKYLRDLGGLKEVVLWERDPRQEPLPALTPVTEAECRDRDAMYASLGGGHAISSSMRKAWANAFRGGEWSDEHFMVTLERTIEEDEFWEEKPRVTEVRMEDDRVWIC